VAAAAGGSPTCHQSQGEYGRAVLLHEEALAMLRRRLPEDHPHITTSLDDPADCHASQGEYGKAVLLHEEALATRWRRLLTEDHPDIATPLNNLATCRESQAEYSKAVLVHGELLALVMRRWPGDAAVAAAGGLSGHRHLPEGRRHHQSQGEYGKTVLLCEEALAMQRRLLPENDDGVGWPWVTTPGR
jgi:tetratricopeptide (TPR) repeat protein